MLSMNDLQSFPLIPNKGKISLWYTVIKKALRVDENQQLPSNIIIAHEYSHYCSFIPNNINTDKFSYITLWHQTIDNLIFEQILKISGSFADNIHCTYQIVNNETIL